MSGVVITPPHPNIEDPNISCEDFFFPSVILWNPYVAYPTLFPPGSILCPTCGGTTKFSYWNDGSSTSTQPRILHDLHNTVLLVSAVYACDNRHNLLAYNDIILQRFPTCCMIPFILLSRTGFTTDLVNMCTSLCTHGMNFYNIETFILERRLDAHARQQKRLTSMFGECGHGHDFQTSHFSNSPSNDNFKFGSS